MTAVPADVADPHIRATRVIAVRSFIRGKRRRPWYDWYAIGFGIALVALMMSDFLSAPFGRLMTSSGTPPAQAEAGAALVIAAAAVLIMLAQLLGPLALSPADASWLLLTPLNRRDILRRPAATVAAVCALAGALLGVLALAMAGPYLRHGPRHQLWAWLLPAAVSGAGFFVAVALTAILAQPQARWRARLRAVCAIVSAAAAVCALAGERWTVVPRHVTAFFADLSITAAVWVMVAAVATACVVALLLWLSLPRFPASMLRSDSARAGTTRLAAAYLNVPLLTVTGAGGNWPRDHGRGHSVPPRWHRRSRWPGSTGAGWRGDPPCCSRSRPPRWHPRWPARR
jgi:Family of unknown function (DUF6297)